MLEFQYEKQGELSNYDDDQKMCIQHMFYVFQQ